MQAQAISEVADLFFLMFSVKPEYAKAILEGRKPVELRRVRPTFRTGAKVLLYASSPQRCLVGGATVGRMQVAEPVKLWRWAAGRCGLERPEFDRYFERCRRGSAIELVDVWSIAEPIPLVELRRRLPGFRPPQSYQFLLMADVCSLLTKGVGSGLETLLSSSFGRSA